MLFHLLFLFDSNSEPESFFNQLSIQIQIQICCFDSGFRLNHLPVLVLMTSGVLRVLIILSGVWSVYCKPLSP